MFRSHNYDGIFYPKDNELLKLSINNFYKKLDVTQEAEKLEDIVNNNRNRKIWNFLVPHGSYYFSGYVASFVYYIIDKIDCDNFIILSSDHNGTSPGISILNKGLWATPLGDVQINEKMAKEMKKFSQDHISIDPLSFDIDHTIEIQIPFIKLKKKDLKILPILQKKQDKITSKRLARTIYSILPPDENIVFIATSNLSHYLNYEVSKVTDNNIIKEILSMDLDSFYKALTKSNNICGYGCIATFIAFSNFFCNSKIILLKYQNSGDVDGNESSVVGYASMIAI